MASLKTAKHFCEWLDHTSGFASSTSKHEETESEGKAEREIPLRTIRQLAEMGDEDVIIFHRKYKPIEAHRMGISPYPELAIRQLMAPPPVLALPAPSSTPRFPEWRRRSLGRGHLRIDPGAYPMPAPQM